MLEPRNAQVDDAIILEFKVFDKYSEKSLEETVQSALRQIEEKQYAASWEAKGIADERIRKYGFAFEGKKGFDWQLLSILQDFGRIFHFIAKNNSSH